MVGRRVARSLTRALVGALGALSVVAATPDAVAAAEGLETTSTTTYTIDPAAGVVRVRAVMEVRNTIPDRVEGNVVRQAYFEGITLPVPAGALNPAATTDGRPLTITTQFVEGTETFYIIDIEFARRLFFDQSTTIEVTYDLTGLPPRSENPWRVNAAYASFSAFGVGDPGKVTIHVVAPPGFTVETFGETADISQTSDGVNTVFTATNITAPDEFEVYISASNPDQLDSTPIEAGGADFDVRAWPDDDEWEAFVADRLTRGIPVLSELIGRPWPIDDRLTIRETVTPYLYGYAGWFDPLQNQIEIGEDLDANVVFHELSHAWFNRDWFAERWANEGMAQAFAAAADDQLDGTGAEPDAVDRNDPIAFSLVEWDVPFGEDAAAVEEYGYNAAWYVVDRIIDEIGIEQMQAVLLAVDEGHIAYVGEPAPEPTHRAITDWQRLLDLLEETGGSEQATELFAEYVLTDAWDDRLDERAAARTSYAELEARRDGWSVPLPVRTAMDGWRFDDAEDLIADASAVLARFEALVTASNEIGVGVPATFEAGYEAVDESFDDVIAALAEQQDAVDLVAETITLEERDDGFFGGIGLIGVDLDSRLADARASLAAGDADAATAIVADIADTLDEADSVGKRRAATAAGAAFGVLVLAAAAAMMIRRRRHRGTAADASAGSADSDGAAESARWAIEESESADGIDGAAGVGQAATPGDVAPRHDVE
jgi:hypothetical protein